MRILNGVLCVLLILFAVAQYNDPDGVFWGIVYGLGALWCGVAAFRSRIFGETIGAALFLVTFAATVAGMVWFWPDTPHWWMQEVWWETETAREGMGMMIMLVAMIAAGLVAWRARSA